MSSVHMHCSQPSYPSNSRPQRLACQPVSAPVASRTCHACFSVAVNREQGICLYIRCTQHTQLICAARPTTPPTKPTVGVLLRTTSILTLPCCSTQIGPKTPHNSMGQMTGTPHARPVDTNSIVNGWDLQVRTSPLSNLLQYLPTRYLDSKQALAHAVYTNPRGHA